MKRLFLWVLLLCLSAQALGEVLPDPINVEVTKSDGVHRLLLQNRAPVPVTYKFDFKLQNAVIEDPGRLKVVVPARSTVNGPVIRRDDPQHSWRWDYKSRYHYGGTTAAESRYLYALPWESGKAYRVNQGFHGSVSHKGKDAYAADFDLPRGTVVVCAREGLVVFRETHFDKGGPSEKYRDFANTLVIAHEDGTLTRYLHFQKDTVRPQLGDWVQAGDILGLSGNTGFSTAPHLHFDVYRPGGDMRVETIPFRFQVQGRAVTPREGEVYRR